jgi:Methyltransferase domain
MPALLPLSPAVVPARVVQSAWLEHGPFAFWIVDAIRPRLIVELGSHAGYSFCCFCEQLDRSGIAGRAIAVDTWQGDEHAGAYSDAVYDDLETYVGATYPGRAELKRMTFAEALPSVAKGSVDMLHVDGRHFYDDVVEDFTSWIPKLSDRAVVLFHDTQVRERDFGVYRYWAELEAKYPSFEFHHGHGLGVLAVGSDISEAALALFSLGRDSADAVGTRAAFAAAGGRISADWRRRNLIPRGIKKLKRIVASAAGGSN